jgi:hypothetical protein
MHNHYLAERDLAKGQKLLQRLAAAIHESHRLQQVHGECSEATRGLEISASLLPSRFPE